MTWKPHITVAAIIEKDDHYLLVEERSSDNQIVFNQPAGHLEKNESLIEAVKRETVEETGQIFNPASLIGVYNWPHPSGLKTYIRFAFSGTINFDPTKMPQDDDIISAQWVSYDQINSGSMNLRSPQVLESINDYRNGTRYSTDLIVEFQHDGIATRTNSKGMF